MADRSDSSAQRLHRARIVRAIVANAGYVVVLAVLAAAMVLIGLEYWRRGLVVLGAGTAFAALLRALLPERRLGLLRVRSRLFDVSALALAAAAILVVTWGISPLGTK